MCYIGLYNVSRKRAPNDENDANAEESPDFSILAIAGAMFLLLSIAAADLWASFALCLEGRGSRGMLWFVGRKVFGGCLMCTFYWLIAASIQVLFYSSFENAEMVLGAAAVLFIADVVCMRTTSDCVASIRVPC